MSPRRSSAGVDAWGSAPGGRSSSWTVAIQVGQFALAGMIALVLVGWGLAVASRRVGEREAIVDARAATAVTAQVVVEPLIDQALLDGDADALAEVDAVVTSDVLDETLVRVRIWTADGTIVYSDEPRVIGSTYELGDEELETLENGGIEAEVSDLSKPENRFERPFGKLLEVYLPIHTPSGDPLLFEAYYRYESVEAAGDRVWRSFAPIAIGALVLLQLVQIPLASSLAGRLQQRVREREGLLRRALEASEVERRQIASDLHDGVVQDLAGVQYSLAAAARSDGSGDPNTARVLDESAATVRESIKALRSLLVEIYPPNLEEEGLSSALSDLLVRTSVQGVQAELDSSGLREPLPVPVAGLLYRAAQEGLRNALNHAHPSSVCIRVSAIDGHAVLEVIDDGTGFGGEVPDGSDEGTGFGLRGLAGLVADAGGSFDVRSSPDDGTTLRVEVPL